MENEDNEFLCVMFGVLRCTRHCSFAFVFSFTSPFRMLHMAEHLKTVFEQLGGNVCMEQDSQGRN